MDINTFLHDLEQFIVQHPYTQKQATNHPFFKHPKDDVSEMNINTPDGEYEQIQIKVNCIA